jgi:hypothetical protein
MLTKTAKAGLCRTIESQNKQQVTLKQKVVKGAKIGLRSTKGKNTTSMVDLHKAIKQESENSAKNLTSSKHNTKQEDTKHKEMLQQELDKFRKGIEMKFRCSETNRSYVFPRNTEFEHNHFETTEEPNCKN